MDPILLMLEIRDIFMLKFIKGKDRRNNPTYDVAGNYLNVNVIKRKLIDILKSFHHKFGIQRIFNIFIFISTFPCDK